MINDRTQKFKKIVNLTIVPRAFHLAIHCSNFILALKYRSDSKATPMTSGQLRVGVKEILKRLR